MMEQAEPLWTETSATGATGGHAPVPFAAHGVQIDSRAILPNDLFVALEGVNNNGHDFIRAAADAGAAAAVVSASWAAENSDPPLPVLAVADTYRALYDLAATARKRAAGKVIAVTGSMGKTGVKESLAAALRRLGRTHCTQGNQNNHYGLPLTLARFPASAGFGVFELGMDHAGEIEPLSALLRPHVAVITTVAPVHIEFFDSVAGIADAKAEIFAGLEPGATAVLPRDNEWFDRLVARAQDRGVERIVTFGGHPEADFRIASVAVSQNGSDVEADTPIGPLHFHVGLPGRHWAVNSLAVAAALNVVGADVTQALGALADLSPTPGRGERTMISLRCGASATVIDESYNANPDSIDAALAVARMAADASGGRSIAVLGDMRELGDAAQSMHAGLSASVLDNRVDALFLCGPHMKHLADALAPGFASSHTDRSTDLIAPLLAALQPNDVIVVKGSLGTNMRPVVDALCELNTIPAAEKV